MSEAGRRRSPGALVTFLSKRLSNFPNLRKRTGEVEVRSHGIWGHRRGESQHGFFNGLLSYQEAEEAALNIYKVVLERK